MKNKQKIKNFILSAIAQRNYLISIGKNKKDLSRINQAKTMLLTYVASIPTTHRMAKFFVTNYQKIIYLLPPSRYNIADEIYKECQALIN